MKKQTIKEQRESRKLEMKEKYREITAQKRKEELANTNYDDSKTEPELVDTVIVNDNTEILDIESKNESITLYMIMVEMKANVEERKRGNRAPKVIRIGVYSDIDMRDRAFTAVKKSIASKHTVKEAGSDNVCFVVFGLNPEFEQFKYKVYKAEQKTHTNVLNRNQIRDLFDVEV